MPSSIMLAAAASVRRLAERPWNDITVHDSTDAFGFEAATPSHNTIVRFLTSAGSGITVVCVNFASW